MSVRPRRAKTVLYIRGDTTGGVPACAFATRRGSGPRQPLVRDAVRTVGLGAELGAAVLLVGLEVALEPRHLGVALEREHVGRDPVQEPAIVGDHHRAAGEA